MSVCFPLVSTCLRWFICKSLERIKGQRAEEVFRELEMVMNPGKEALAGEIQSLQSLIPAFFMLGLVDCWCCFVLGSITDAALGSFCETCGFVNRAEGGKEKMAKAKQIKELQGTNLLCILSLLKFDQLDLFPCKKKYMK